MRYAVLFTMTPWLAGCPMLPCTDVDLPGVEVTVFDEAGDPHVPEAVLYAVRDGAESPCTRQAPDSYVFECGLEQHGPFVVRVIDGGEVVAEEMLRVRRTDDLCHPVTEQLDIQL